MAKLAIIGASYLQLPLIERAKELGYETHVFAWAADDVGEKVADRFHPISIVEIDAIRAKCEEIGISGICTIASDLAAVTVNCVASKMGLPGNDLESSLLVSNKRKMRECFFAHGVPSPRSVSITNADLLPEDFRFPLIVKPTDRSGSRGVTRVDSPDQLSSAISAAAEQSFLGEVVVEEFVTGTEYSIEGLTYNGIHHIFGITRKYTTGAPHFIETAHLHPAPLDESLTRRICENTRMALDSVGMSMGATHTELKVSANGDINLIEVGGRMGGDHIGSSLVPLSTGIDYMKAVIDCATGNDPCIDADREPSGSAIRFVFTKDDLDILERIREEHPEYLVEEKMVLPLSDHVVLDSSERYGYYILKAGSSRDLEPYLSDLDEASDQQA